jgi:hypothetical protein
LDPWGFSRSPDEGRQFDLPRCEAGPPPYNDIRQIPDGVLTSDIHERLRTLTIASQPDLRADAAKALRKLPLPRD